MKKVIDTKAGTITFTFDGHLPVVFNPSCMSQANKDYGLLHGMAARIGDNAAIQKSAENGYTVTEAMRREAVMELVTHYESSSDEWSPKAKAKAPAQNATILAIAAKLGKTYAEAEAYVAERMLAEMAE